MPCRECSRLVECDGVNLLEGLEGLGVLDEDSSTRAASGANHDRHWSGQSQGARTSNDKNGHRVDDSIGETRLRADGQPDYEGDGSDRQHCGHEPGGDAIGKALDGSAAALGVTHHLDDLRQHGFTAHALGTHQKPAGSVDGGADDLIAGALFDRHRLARDHRFVHGTQAVEDGSVGGNFFSRTDAQLVANLNLIEWDVVLTAVIAHEARHLRSEVEQRANGSAGAAAGFEFQHLAEQDEHDDGCGCFEVHCGLSVRTAQRFGKESAAQWWRRR